MSNDAINVDELSGELQFLEAGEDVRDFMERIDHGELDPRSPVVLKHLEELIEKGEDKFREGVWPTVIDK